MPKTDWKFLGLILCCLALAVWLGFILGRLSYQNSRGAIDFTPVDKNTSLYDSKMATVVGQILDVNGRTILIQNSQGVKGYVDLSSRFTVSKIKDGQRNATTSAEVKFIEKNQIALITVNLQNNVYKITSISYLPPAPPAQPENSSSPAQK